MSDGFESREFVAGYLAEAQELLASANAQLLAIEEAGRRGAPHPRAVRELFRALHTLKGLSAMIGAEPIVDVAHEMETLLRAANGAGGRLPAGAVDLLLAGVKAVEARVAHLARGERIPPPPAELVAALGALQRPAAEGTPVEISLPPELAAKLSAAEREELVRAVAAGRRARRVDFIPSPDRAAKGVNITSVRERVSALGDIVKVLPRGAAPGETAPAGLAFVLLVVSDVDDARLAEAADADPASVVPLSAAAPAPAPAPVDDEPPQEVAAHLRRYVRVDVARLDEAVERLSALVVTRSRLQLEAARLARGGADTRDLQRILQENARQLRDLRASIMRARMVAVSELLERAPLIVRGLAQSSGKKVRLVVDAGDAELDKAVGERLFPVIVHLLRNAVDHAIEGAEERRAAGKPEEGLIGIACAPRSDHQLELVVEDDGRGIDREAVARRAGAPVPATDAELLDLIARPGLSTVEQATRTSGRGVGMDVVKRVTVAELGGELLLATRPGQGTRFTMRVPLSVTIVDAFTFACGDDVFVVPVNAVEDLLEVSPDAAIEVPDPARRHDGVRLLRRRGETLPLVSLHRLLGVAAPAAARPKAIVVRRDGEAWALQVDRMIGQQEVVVRPLADPLVHVEGVTGTTDLGDGRPTLVLDLAALTRAAAPRGAAGVL